MKGFFESFLLEWRSLLRSKTMLLLAVLAVAWMFAMPHLFRFDGTVDGARELCVRFSLGGVVAMLAVSLAIAAAGSLSRERRAKRLPLTMVRPVRFFAIAAGKISALTLAGAVILAFAAAVELVRQDPHRPCHSVYRPVLPTPMEEAAQMYDVYMADPNTPPAVKKAKKSHVLKILAQRAFDHYQTIPTNSTATWQFSPNLPHSSLLTSHSSLLASPYSLRLRFTNLYNMRDEVRGNITSSIGAFAAVSNITQAIVTIPLTPNPQPSTPNPTKRLASSTLDLSFSNSSSRAVMLRPRMDIELLVRADNFAFNLLRAYLELVAMLAVLIAFGVFLGAALSRPVAVFVAVVTLTLSEMSPSVIEHCPDDLETSRADAMGLSLARFAAAVTHPIGSLSPLSELSADNCIEPRHVARAWMIDGVLIPFFFALLTAVAIAHKKED